MIKLFLLAEVSQLLKTCREVLLLNLLVVLLWASAGVQLFGGLLVESNPRLSGKDLGYFSNHYEARRGLVPSA